MNTSYPGLVPKTAGSWLALATTLLGAFLPLVPVAYQPLATAILAGVGTAATKLQ